MRSHSHRKPTQPQSHQNPNLHQRGRSLPLMIKEEGKEEARLRDEGEREQPLQVSWGK